MGPAKSARIIPTFAPVRHPKRHQTRQRVDNLRGAMSHRTIRRLARRGGIVRISTSIYEEVQETVRKRIEEIMHFLVLYVGEFISLMMPSLMGVRRRWLMRLEHSNRKTVNTYDVIWALKRLGITLYVSLCDIFHTQS
ncbi:MAG: hypothetical protein Q9159_000738 [Coniocarpon cinnabarinum]